MSSTQTGSIQSEIWRVVASLDDLPAAPMRGHRINELATFFEALHLNNGEERQSAETGIWTIWCDHGDVQAKSDLKRGIELITSGNLHAAMPIFDGLTETCPIWAEPWNKRATLHFLLGQDSASVRDIYAVLNLEPRHFGALGGLAQICLRNDARDAACNVLRCLLDVHPSAQGVAEMLSALDGGPSQTMH
jgi:hypothetical protein